MLRESRDIGARRKRYFQVLRFSGVVSEQEEAVCKEIFRCRLEPTRISRFDFLGIRGLCVLRGFGTLLC